MKSYKTVEKATEARTEVRRSLFISSVSPAATAEEADAFVASVRAKYPDATHNCYAYIADENGLKQKFSDDGEPQGTAGMPMLEVLKSHGLKKCAAVVTRYFGGVKLGAGGLVRAYAKAAADGVRAAKIVKYVFCDFVRVGAGYETFPALLKFSEKKNYKIMDTQFSERAEAAFAVPREKRAAFEEDLAEAFGGKLRAENAGSGYYAFGE